MDAVIVGMFFNQQEVTLFKQKQEGALTVGLPFTLGRNGRQRRPAALAPQDGERQDDLSSFFLSEKRIAFKYKELSSPPGSTTRIWHDQNDLKCHYR